MKEKCRYHCYKAVHIHNLHLFGLSWENFELEVPGKIRLRIRAIKILFNFGLIVLVMHMVRIVRSNAIMFMLSLSIFVERWESYRAFGWLEEEDEVHGHGSVSCYVVFVSHKSTDVWPPQWQGSMLVRPMSWVRTLTLPFVFFTFFSTFSFGFLQVWASTLGLAVFFF